MARRYLAARHEREKGWSPLDYAYAGTIMRNQGTTIHGTALVRLSPGWESDAVHVATSRATEETHLYGLDRPELHPELHPDLDLRPTRPARSGSSWPRTSPARPRRSLPLTCAAGATWPP